jgi:putative chitinase
MTDFVTRELVQRISQDADTWFENVRDACNDWSINTWPRVSMFLAQTAHESAGFRRLVENLKYSAAGLRRTWPNRFTEADADEMAYNEFAIAERAYGGRMGNGPEGSGDGYNFRGRGLIQITGRTNYLITGEHIGTDVNNRPDPEAFIKEPDLLAQPMWAAYAAACYWDIHGCSELADTGNFEQITRVINGGLNGYDDRLHWLDVVKEFAP